MTYWLTLGEAVASPRTDRKVQQIRYGLRGEVRDGMLVRVSSIDRDAAHGFILHGAFLQAMAAAIPDPFKSRILGLPA